MRFVSYFDPVAFVFVMTILSFLLFSYQRREAMYSTLHDSHYMVSRVMGGGHRQWLPAVLHAMPANALYDEYVKSAAHGDW